MPTLETHRVDSGRARGRGWAVAVLTALLALGRGASQPSADAEQVWLVAHRGASAHAPENTFEAFGAAIRLGADVVELDIQLSRDGVPVVIHDDTLERTTNVAQVFPHRARDSARGPTWRVKDFVLSDLRRLDAGSWYSPSFAGARIPTLTEALRHIDGRAAVIVDVKMPVEINRAPLTAAQRVVAAIAAADQRDAADWIAISSFDRRDLSSPAYARLARFLAVDPVAGVPAYSALFPPGACGLSASRRLLDRDPAIVARARSRGRLVIAWSFDNQARIAPSALQLELRRYIDTMNVHGLITNRLTEFRSLRPGPAQRPSWSVCHEPETSQASPRPSSSAPPPAPTRRRQAIRRN